MKNCTPEEQGVMSEGILAFINSLEKNKINAHSLLIIRHGHVIAKGWWVPYAPEAKRYVYSVSKSFTSTAVGFAVDEGLLTVCDKVVSFFPDEVPQDMDKNLAAMTVRDLLTMTTGHEEDTLLALSMPDESWVRAILSLPVKYTPGTHFLYNSGASYLLAAIVQKVTGKTVLEYLNVKLFGHLGIQNVTWDESPQGINTGGWGIKVSTEDLAKFGLFYLQKGVWDGVQLLSREWVEEATAACVRNDLGIREREPADWKEGYGYQFWRCRHGAYRADGAMGQYCIVMPDQDAVIVVTAEVMRMQDVLDLVWEHVLPAMKDAKLPCHAAAALQEKLASLALDPQQLQDLPEIAAKVSGKSYEIYQNKLHIHSLSFDFEKAESCALYLRDDTGEHVIKCGNGEWIKGNAIFAGMIPGMMAFLPNHNAVSQRIAVQGVWTDAQTLQIRIQYLETPHCDSLSCVFEGNEISVRFISSFLQPGHPLYESERCIKGIQVNESA